MVEKLRNSNRLFIVPIIFVIVLGLILMTAMLPMMKKTESERCAYRACNSRQRGDGDNISGHTA